MTWAGLSANRKWCEPSSRVEDPGLDCGGGANRRLLGGAHDNRTGLATSSVASLAWDFRGLVTGSIDGQTLPVYADAVNRASVVMAAGRRHRR